MNETILEMKDITKRYKNQTIVKDISIAIPRNSVYGLLGPNGAGKSTILKMMTGMIKPTKGTILFENKKWNRKALNHIGSLVESAPLYENLTAYENLLVRTTALGLPKERIKEVLEIVDLKNTKNKSSGKFSMGMKQRLGIAIALLNHPSLLLLDEPTNGLDPVGIMDLRNLIKSFPQKGITVLISSHMLSEIEQMATHIGIISGGVVGYQGGYDTKVDLEKLFMKVVSTYRREEK